MAVKDLTAQAQGIANRLMEDEDVKKVVQTGIDKIEQRYQLHSLLICKEC